MKLASSVALRFRELEAVELWSARLELNVGYDEFSDAVTQLAAEDGQRYTGFITKADDVVTSFTRTRYPRRKYGVASIRDCQEGMETLTGILDGTLRPDTQSSGIRVVLGLIEGYDSTAPRHSVEEVRAALVVEDVEPAEVFALRSQQGEVSIYTEPVAVVRAPLTEAARIYELAEGFKQERFCVENFDLGLTHMVETVHCKEPD